MPNSNHHSQKRSATSIRYLLKPSGFYKPFSSPSYTGAVKKACQATKTMPRHRLATAWTCVWLHHGCTPTRRGISATYSDVPDEVQQQLNLKSSGAFCGKISLAVTMEGMSVMHLHSTKMPEVVSIHFLETRHTSTPPTSSVSVSQVIRIS